MASPNIHTNGIGGTSGAELATVSPLYTSGEIWYVSSSIGVDAASPRGKERVRPLATLAQAHTNAAAGDIIVCLSGHTEILTAAQTFSKAGILLLGEGTGSNRPKFQRNGNVVLFDVTAAGVILWNLYFQASASASANSRVKLAGAADYIYSCYFESGASDTGPATETVTGASDINIVDTTYLSTGTLLTAQPESAIKVTNALTTLELENVVFDGGTVGWSNPYAFNGAAAITRLWAQNVDLFGDSDVTLATGTTGHWHTRNKTGSARVVWTA